MEWFRHKTASHEDPDISDALDIFGDSGYSVFFIILEIYGRKFNHINKDGELIVAKKFLKRKLRKKWISIINIFEFYSQRKRFIYKILDDNFISIKVPQFIELSSDQARGQTITLKPKKSTKKKEAHISPSCERLAKKLFSLILQNDPKAKKPNFSLWAKTIDKLMRIDKRAENEIEEVIEWCQNDDFWKGNILSVDKLRKQFTQLVIKMNKRKQFGGLL